MLSTKEKYLRYIDDIVQLTEETSLSSDALKQLKENITHAELLVPVIGSFSAGKSSLLNAFLQQDILPVGIAPETELATELRYSKDPHYLALRTDGSSERIELSESDSIKPRAAEFAYLQLYLDNTKLEQFPNLVLVDMPGFGSSLENHNKAINHYLPCGAHFIVITSVEEGTISQSMQRQLDELHIWGRSCSHVLSKANLRADEEVFEVAASIERQTGRSAITIGADGHERMVKILAAIDCEKLFQALFLDRLKDLTHSLLSQVDVVMAALKKSHAQNTQMLEDLEDALRNVEKERDKIISAMDETQLNDIVKRCLSALEKELKSASTELAEKGASGDRHGFNQVVSEIIRIKLTEIINNEMRTLSRDVTNNIANSISGLGNNMNTFIEEPGWLDALSGQAQRSLSHFGESVDKLSNWADSKKGNPTYTIYRSAATVLAVTTNIMLPVIELVIIFLPDIIRFLKKNETRRQFEQKVMYEIIPALIRNIRPELTGHLKEEIAQMTKQIHASFAQELDEKKRIIEETQVQQKDENLEQRKLNLLEMRSQILQLSKEFLLSGECKA